MIGKLKGIVTEIAEDHIIVDVNGVGYLVYVTSRMLSKLTCNHSISTFFIETQMHNNCIRLFGFPSKIEQKWFRLLQNVQGVGTKIALAILGVLEGDEIANAITSHNTSFISRTPGVGRKVAERIIIELKGKIPINFMTSTEIIHSDLTRKGEYMILDAISALCNLGYSREQASNAVSIAFKKVEPTTKLSELIQLSLKDLSV